MAAALERLASQRRRSSFTQQQGLETEVRRHRKTAIDTFTNPAFDDGQAPASAEGSQQRNVPHRRTSTVTRQQTVGQPKQRQPDAAASRPKPQGSAQRPPQVSLAHFLLQGETQILPCNELQTNAHFKIFTMIWKSGDACRFSVYRPGSRAT